MFLSRNAEVEAHAELRRAAGRMALELHGAYRPEELVGFAAEADLAAFP